MQTTSKDRLISSFSIIWTIAWKDVIDALRNKVVTSTIIMLTLLLITPKLLPYIFEPPQTITIPVYDLGESSLTSSLRAEEGIEILNIRSELEFDQILCGGINPLVGITLPVDFDIGIENTETVDIQGFVCWSKRHRVEDQTATLENVLSQLIKQPVKIHLEGNYTYPPSVGALPLSLATLNSIVLILLMGLFLISSLILEEKEAKTIHALLVSPASISQVVIGKALAGAFYILVTAALMFTISWSEVTHWGIVALFVFGGGMLSIAVGLVLGSFFEKQQDIVGWMTVILVLFVGTIFLRMIGLELPLMIDAILPWLPSVALTEICLAAFSENVNWGRVLLDLGILLVVSLPLYLLVIWKIKRADR
jgi:ABC-2 type transport system permease protein